MNIILQAVEHMERLKSQKVEPPPEVVGEYCRVFKKYMFQRLSTGVNLELQTSICVSVEGNALPEIHAVDNQPPMIQEVQPQEHHVEPQNPHDTPQEHLQQQNQILAQQGFPQSHQNLPPGNQEATQGQQHLQ